MDIKLKNIRHMPSLSEETEAFTADLYINGKKAGVTSNQGHGGNTGYHALSEAGKQLIKEAEQYCKSLPPQQIPNGDGSPPLELNPDLESVIDDLLYEHLREKELRRFNKKMEKAMVKGLVYGVPGDHFKVVPLLHSVAKTLQMDKGPLSVASQIQYKVLPHLQEGEMLLNTNIPEGVCKAAGLKEEQYSKQAETSKNQVKPRPSRKPGR